MPTRYAIILAYDGTDFCGWQRQLGTGKHANPKPSIEGTIADAIDSLCGETISVVASGRTDAGVHASGQVAHFTLSDAYHAEDHFLDGLNRLLPNSVRIHQLVPVSEAFSARDATEKQYSYYFQQGLANLPHLERYSMWNRHPLEVEWMQEATRCLLGEHDFSGFGNSSDAVTSTVRTVREVEVTEEPIPLPGNFCPERQSVIRFRIRGTGFLKQMVRSLAGTLKQVGEGRRPPCDMEMILQSCDHSQIGQVAPATGLWLDQVWYETGPGIDSLNQFGR
ncbi:MAG: tRNA pseudouridine(38-40) synthase TruA [Verrucomicrobiales bacterium]|nr:tRNA pseudouridine(38-40) synthase TruA [Verrucomicrobiales bacterium]